MFCQVEIPKHHNSWYRGLMSTKDKPYRNIESQETEKGILTWKAKNFAVSVQCGKDNKIWTAEKTNLIAKKHLWTQRHQKLYKTQQYRQGDILVLDT